MKDTRRFPIMGFDPDTPVRSAIMQALGAASMCWTETPNGVFQSQRATDIGNELLDLIASRTVFVDDNDIPAR